MIEVDPQVMLLTVVTAPVSVTAAPVRPELALTSAPPVQIQVQTQLSSLTVTSPGPQGPVGPTGPVGPAGFYYRHDQSSAASTWIVNHNLGATPNTTVLLSGEVVYPDITHGSLNQTSITFFAPVSGVAIFS